MVGDIRVAEWKLVAENLKVVLVRAEFVAAVRFKDEVYRGGAILDWRPDDERLYNIGYGIYYGDVPGHSGMPFIMKACV